VAATDDPRAQLALNRFSYLGGRPAVFVGLYAGAEGGEVIFTLPERTACYLCSTTIRHGLSEGHGQLQPEIDYGTGRLTGQVALAADIHHVSSAAVKIILALFPNSPLQGFLAQPLARGQTYLTLSTVAGYWFYPSLFGDVPGQHAYQAVWLQPTRRDDCPVCGLPEQRVGLLDAPLRTPRVRLHAAP
jgi:hypothetical protein